MSPTLALLLAGCILLPGAKTTDSDGVDTTTGDSADTTGTGDSVDTEHSGAETADSAGDTEDTGADTDTGATASTELPGNGVDEDLDGAVDEFRVPDLSADFYGITSAMDGYVALCDAESGSGLKVVDRATFLSADWTGHRGYYAGDGGYGIGQAAQWIPDVDGDGNDDLLGSSYRNDSDGNREYAFFVYAWADITTRDVGTDEAIATVGDWGSSGVSNIVLVTASDGDNLLSYVRVEEGGTSVSDWFMPYSCFADGACDTDEAVARVDGVKLPAQEDGPVEPFDFDGDGVDDVLLQGNEGWGTSAVAAQSALLYSGTQLDTLGLQQSDATWYLDVASENPDLDLRYSAMSDVDGDGYVDLVGNATPPATLDYACEGFVVLGPFAGASAWSDVATHWPMGDGVACGDTAFVGDLDGDGRSDWAIAGQPGAPTYTEPGRVDVVLASTLAAGGTLDPELDRWAVINGLADDDRVGIYLYPFDFDGDGTQDLAAYSYETFASDGTAQQNGTEIWFDVRNPG